MAEPLASRHNSSVAWWRGLPGWLIVSLLLHLAAGAFIATHLSTPSGASEAGHPPPPLVRPERPQQLGGARMRVVSLAWLGRPGEPGVSGSPSTVDQAELRMAEWRELRALGGRAAGAARQAERTAREAAEAAAAGARSLVARVAGTLLAPRSDGQGDRRRPPTEADDRSADEAPIDAAGPSSSGSRGAAEQTTGDSDTATTATGADSAEPGDDEREAPATRRLELREEQLGEPVEAFGLQILTRRPRFTLYTEIRARIGNPRVLLVFDRKGVVRELKWVNRSGDADVDSAVANALYQWKAVPSREEDTRDTLPTEIEFTVRLVR